jgi:hypothetical protein
MKQIAFRSVFKYAILILLAGLTQGEAAGPAKPSLPKGWQFSFPEGDAKAGKTVFMNMQCYSCHATQLPRESLAAPAGRVGPDLTGYANLPKEYLAESIIKAHTIVAAPGYTVKEGKAAMGNYNHFMTIQEMIDIVAFLKHGLDGKGK